MKEILDKALPLSEILWRKETEGRPIDTPERKAALEKDTFTTCATRCADAAVQGYYRNFFQGTALAGLSGEENGCRDGHFQGRGAAKRFGRFANQGSDSQVLPSSAIQRSSVPGGGRREELILLTVVNHPEIMENHFDTLGVPCNSPALNLTGCGAR